MLNRVTTPERDDAGFGGPRAHSKIRSEPFDPSAESEETERGRGVLPW